MAKYWILFVSHRVWGDDIKGIDCGEEAASWLKRYFDADYRLMFFPRGATTREVYKAEKTSQQKSKPYGKAYLHYSFVLRTVAQTFYLNQGISKLFCPMAT